jgi:hypothetical protein
VRGSYDAKAIGVTKDRDFLFGKAFVEQHDAVIAKEHGIFAQEGDKLFHRFFRLQHGIPKTASLDLLLHQLENSERGADIRDASPGEVSDFSDRKIL